MGRRHWLPNRTHPIRCAGLFVEIVVSHIGHVLFVFETADEATDVNIDRSTTDTTDSFVNCLNETVLEELDTSGSTLVDIERADSDR